MSLEIGRQGYLGLAIEAVAGTPESSPDVFIPFTENSLQDKHEPLMDISARASRVKDHDAVIGKKWGEGDVQMYFDSINAGYLFKMALGGEINSQVGSSNAYDHSFTPTVSGNNPTAATLWNYRGDDVSVKRFSYACVDQLELEITNEDIGVMTASVLSAHPSQTTAPTLTTTSGTLLTWKDTTVRFGTTLQDALIATPTKLTSLTLSIANNVEPIYRTGSNEPDVFVLGELEVTGEYSLFLENDTEVDIYRNLTKRCMVVDCNGANIGGGNQERVRIIVKNVFIEDHEPETDLDGLWAINQTFRAIQGTQVDPGFLEVIVRNQKSAAY